MVERGNHNPLEVGSIPPGATKSVPVSKEAQAPSPLACKAFDDAGKLIKFVNENNLEVVSITSPHNFNYVLFYREKC